jgi:hypothetical protein
LFLHVIINGCIKGLDAQLRAVYLVLRKASYCLSNEVRINFQDFIGCLSLCKLRGGIHTVKAEGASVGPIGTLHYPISLESQIYLHRVAALSCNARLAVGRFDVGGQPIINEKPEDNDNDKNCCAKKNTDHPIPQIAIDPNINRCPC